MIYYHPKTGLYHSILFIYSLKTYKSQGLSTHTHFSSYVPTSREAVPLLLYKVHNFVPQ